MLTARGGPRRGDAASLRSHPRDEFVRVKRIANPNYPSVAFLVIAAALDVAASVDVEVLRPGSANEIGRVADGPALDDSGRIKLAIRPADFKIPLAFALRLLGEFQHLA